MQSLDDNKGMDIVSIPAGKSTIADYMIIATGASNRQVAAMADNVEFKLKAGVAIMGKEGTQQADWVLLATAEVIVHIFRPEVREFTRWRECGHNLRQVMKWFMLASLFRP